MSFRDRTPEPLPDDYYLTNFHTVLDFVDATYADMLVAAEREWLAGFRGVDAAAQRLYVRLIGRKGSLFRLERLDYPEIADLAGAASMLADAGLVDTAVPTDDRELLAAFTLPKLRKRLGQAVTAGASRADVVADLLDGAESESDGWRSVLSAGPSWLRVLGHAESALFSLCFFGNLRQNTSEFVMSDLGTVRYERYAIDASVRAFASREQIDAHLRFHECAWLIEHTDQRDAIQLLAHVDELPSCLPGDRALARRLDRLRNGVARQLERLGESAAALALYEQSTRPPARERRLRLLLADRRIDEVLALCEEMQGAPLAESERQVVERVQRQLARKGDLDLKISARPFRPQTETVVMNPGDARVEPIARAFYARYGACFIVESRLVCGVLGLFLWDIIFMPVRGAFFHPFQSAPSDFRDPGFRAAREPALSERLSELDDTERFRSRVLDTWEHKRGISNPWVSWSRLPTELLRLALVRIPPVHWRAMFERVLADVRENSSGLPDLVLFRDGGDVGDYEFIEIKGPGDALQSNQRRWMHYLMTHRIPHRVVQVRWSPPAT